LEKYISLFSPTYLKSSALDSDEYSDQRKKDNVDTKVSIPSGSMNLFVEVYN
jgi:hypothetical protein